MATAFYLNNAKPPFIPTNWRGSWDSNATSTTNNVMCSCMDPNKLVGSNAAAGRAETSASSGFKVGCMRLISRRLAAQTISGTVDMIVSALESNAAADFYTKLYIYVTEGDTDTVRGTLLDYAEASGTGTEWPTTSTGIGLASAQSLSSVAAQEGDRICVELGYTAFNAVTTSRTGTLRLGCRSNFAALSDLTVGSTSNLAPSITFSGTIALSTTEPANVTPETATVISALPYDSGSVNPITNAISLFYKRTVTSGDQGYLYAFPGVTAPASNYAPYLIYLLETAGVIALHPTYSGSNVGYVGRLPVTTGDIIYWQVFSDETATATTANLRFTVVGGVAQAADLTSQIFISSDSASDANLPAILLDPSSGAVLGTIRTVVPTENGAVADNGVSCFTSKIDKDAYLYDTSLVLIASANTCTSGGQNFPPVASDGTNFYIAQYQSAVNFIVTTKIDQTGAILATWNIPVPASWTNWGIDGSHPKQVYCIAASRDGGTLLLSDSYDVAVAAYDLTNSVALPTFYTATYGVDDMSSIRSNTFVLSEVDGFSVVNPYYVTHLDATGALINRYTYTVSRTNEILDHFAPDYQVEYVWAWIHYEDAGGRLQHEFRKTQLSDGVIVTTLTTVKDDAAGINYSLGEELPIDGVYRGIPDSCPLIVFGARAATTVDTRTWTIRWLRRSPHTRIQ